MAEALEVTVARIDGKLDALSIKLDANKDILLTQILSGDKESMQAIELVAQRIGQLEQKGHDRDRRMDGIRQDLENFKSHVESSELLSANKKIEWNRQTVVTLIGWLIAIAAVVGALAK